MKSLFSIHVLAVLSGVLCLNGILITEAQQDEAFSAFLGETIKNFSVWLSDHNLDTSAPVAGPAEIGVHNNVVDLNCQIRDYYIKGISSESVTYYPSGSIQNARIQMDVDLSSPSSDYLVIGGNYNANGSILANFPLSGEGHFEIVIGVISQMVDISRFQITPDGYIDIKPATRAFHAELSAYQPYVSTHFEGLFDGDLAGWRGIVEDGLIQSLNTFLRASATYPFPALDLLFNYLDEVFSTTPLDDIIGWKL